MTILSWSVKIRFKQLEEYSRISICSEMCCFVGYKDVIESSWDPFGVLLYMIDQLHDVTSKLPIISTKSSFRLYIVIPQIILIKEAN